jgi:hypothetical protein
VVVESAPAGGLGPFAGTPASDAAIVAEGTAALDVQADAPAGGFLVLTDPYYPGWQAFVDGQETPILRADYLFRAVALPPGAHDVHFTFTPRSLETGVTLSLAGVAIAVLAVLVGLCGPLVRARPWRRLPWRRRRRVAPPGETTADRPPDPGEEHGADSNRQ